MQILTASEARANLYRLMDQTAESHQPVTIAGKRHSAVLLSAEDWEAIQETLFLLSIPGMRESVKNHVLRTWSCFRPPVRGLFSGPSEKARYRRLPGQTEIALVDAPLSLGIARTWQSSRYSLPPYRRNILLPKSDSPNKVSSS